MTFASPNSIFEDGKLKPETYKIQNIHTQTYLDFHESSGAVCCRPVENLEEGRGLVRHFYALEFAYLKIISGRLSPLGPDILYRV